MAQSAFLEHAPAAALAGLAVGGGARLIKNLFDIARRGAQDEVSKLSITEQPVAEVPMEVSEEEADELRRSGVRIQRLKQVQPSEKLAGDFSTSPASSQIGIGFLATMAALGGWKLTDMAVDSIRKGMVQRDLDAVRKRIKRVVNDDPEMPDTQLHAYMKAAEDHYFAKEAGEAPTPPAPAAPAAPAKPGILDRMTTGLRESWDTVTSPDSVAGRTMPTVLLTGLGGIGAIGLVSAYNMMQEQSKHKAKVKALKNYVKYLPEAQPIVTVKPIVVERTPGSPSQQAETNAVATGV